MSLTRKLDDDESYLWAILSDESGLELAEFYLEDPTSETGRYRAYDYQWSLWRDDSVYQADLCARSLGKTEGVKVRAFAFPFNFPGFEMMLTAPELNHLRMLTDKVEWIFTTTKLGKEMRPRTRGGGINHQPQFQCQFVNGAKIFARLPNLDGRGVKGAHPLRIEMDESQNYPKPGWVEIIETMRSGVAGAQWRCHGVPRGTRDMYYTVTMNEDPDLDFFVHRFIAACRPDWSDEERKRKIALYGGSEENIDYRRNVLGEHGDAYSPLFVLARLMACVRQQESAWATRYNRDIYHIVKITDEMINHRGKVPVETFLEEVPASHLGEQYTSFWGGMDIGYTDDPSEILIFGTAARKGRPDVNRLLLRCQMRRVKVLDQVAVIRRIFEIYGDRLQRFGMDTTGAGLPMWQVMQTEDWHGIIERIAGYGFSEKVPVGLEDREPTEDEQAEDLVLEQNVKDWTSDRLRFLVDNGAIELPYDRELLNEWQGESMTMVQRTNVDGVRRVYSGSLHTLDAARMFAAAKELMLIEELLRPKQEDVLDLFI